MLMRGESENGDNQDYVISLSCFENFQRHQPVTGHRTVDSGHDNFIAFAFQNVPMFSGLARNRKF